MRGIRRLTAGMSALLALSGVAFADSAEIYAKAKQEGKVVIWSSLDVEVQKKVGAKFNQKYPGIVVDAFKIQPGPAIERAVAESRASALSVDVIDVDIPFLALADERGLVEPVDWSSVATVDPTVVVRDGRALVFSQYDIPITYNTNLVKPGEITSWDDLLNPKWKGKLLLEARGAAFAILANQWGEAKMTEYVDKLMANKPFVFKGAVPLAEALAGGQGAIGVGAYAARITLFKEAGAPVDWARVGPIPVQTMVIAPVKGAKHPNAAKLFAAFWTTADARRVLYEDQRHGIGADVSPRGVEILKDNIKVVPEPIGDVETSRRRLTEASRIINGQ